jgi:histone deacetylase complex regulatory component SIN3
MKAYKELRIDTDTVITRLQDILKGNRSLINEVNRILPTDKQIKVVSKKEKKTYNDAISFIGKIKDETSSDSTIYDQFVEILQELKRNNEKTYLYKQA